MKIIVREWKHLHIKYGTPYFTRVIHLNYLRCVCLTITIIYVYFPEFRSFVTKRKVNAISQYFNNCYFEDIVKEKENILNRILQFWETVKDMLPYDGNLC